MPSAAYTYMCRVGQIHIYSVCIRCIYGIFGREVIKYMVIYGVYIRFWPTLYTCNDLWTEGQIKSPHILSTLLSVGPLWLGLSCLLVKEYYSTRYQSGFLFLNQCGEWFSLPARFFFFLALTWMKWIVLTDRGCYACVQGWPELYVYTVYDRLFGDFPANITVYTPYIHCIFG